LNQEELVGAFRPLFYTGTAVQLISVPIHFLGMLLHKEVPANNQEKLLSDLLHTYQFNLGAGFVRTTSDFLTGFGVIYGAFILFFGLINVFAIRQAGDSRFLRTLCWLNTVAWRWPRSLRLSISFCSRWCFRSFRASRFWAPHGRRHGKPNRLARTT